MKMKNSDRFELEDYCSISSDKPFAVNTRGRKRVYTDEERRLRKNNSSKKSREKHTEQVMEKKFKLQQLQDKHRDLVEKRQQLDKEIQEHRQHLCPYCLNVVEEALREIGKGQDIVVLKRVNFCCSTYHAQQSHQQQNDEEEELHHSHHHHHQHQPSCERSNNGSSNGNDNDVIFDREIKNEPSEFS
uniref:BZIP domain-containing protein n=1 Tax=Panagrolaimus sp. ES5 TaxID=591445 RepID=A0AC34FG45_9BILA